MSPTTTEDASTSKRNQSVGGSKSQKDQVQKTRRTTDTCQHLIKATSMPGIRKALKGDIKAVCSFKPSCDIATIPSGSDTASLIWMCLQCGHIGCGNNIAQGGHTEAHFKAPRSDLHCIFLLFQGDLDKGWCFHCNIELDTNSTYFKDLITFLRRSVKVKTALSSNFIQTAPIALGPPPPPPVPKLDPPKPSTLKGKQNKNTLNSSNNSRWDSGDWPLGLDNLGNTCFMNSALQCLSRTRSLTDKLDLYGAGNIIEILVTSDEPYVQVIDANSEQEGSETNSVSDECDKFIERSVRSNAPTADIDVTNLESESSPSSEMDSLLDVASGTSSASDGSGDAVDKEKWAQELECELKKPLRLRIRMAKESMASKLRHCFKAITRTPDAIPNGDSYDRSEFYCRNNSFPTVFSPRFVHQALSRNFRPGQQHDSHELLRTVVDMMKKDQIKAFRLAIMERYGVKKTEGKNCDPKVAELLKMWDRKLYHKTFVDEIFGGELVTTQKCLQCESVRRSHEEFLDLSLPIRVFRANPNPSKKSYSLFDDDHDSVINRSVEDCLRAYTEPEFLTGSNVVECENCHRINLEKLEAGADLEDVFPGIKPKLETNSEDKKLAEKSKHQQKKQNKKRQPRQAKIKAKLDQTDFVLQDNSGMDVGSTLRIVEDHFRGAGDKSTNAGVEEDAKSSKSGSLDDYVVIQSTPMIKEPEFITGNSEMDMDFDLPDLDPCPSSIAGDEKLEAVDNGATENAQSNLLREMSSSLNNLKLIEHGMDVDGYGGGGSQGEETIISGENDDEDMDDLDEPAVDGVGNASDIEDDEGNGLVPLDLGFPEEEKPIGAAEYLSVPVSTGNTASSTVADEGFGSEGSLEGGKNSQSLSASSSRNSISEVDNVDLPSNPTVKKIPVTKCPCSRQQLISRPPDCLTLHLKRFQHTGRGSSKLSDRVTFSYILNLTEFCSEAGEDVTKPGYKSIFDEDGEVVYSLYGIVEHSGSLHFGHYVAYVKVAGKDGETGERAPDKWFYVSDSLVSSSSLRAVLTQEAYILFYERIRGPEKMERLSHLRNLNHEEASTSSAGYDNTDTAASWSNSTSSVSSFYNNKSTVKPSISSFYENNSTTAAVSIGPQWNENWEDSQPVTSSNDTKDDSEVSSSSTQSYPIALPGTDGVSSTTDVMDYMGPVNTSVVVEEDSSVVLDNSTCLMDATTVSSSSDGTPCPSSPTLTKLEEVD